MRKKLKDLADGWMIESRLNRADASRHEMMSEISRAELETEADVLRRCAKDLRRLLKKAAT